MTSVGSMSEFYVAAAVQCMEKSSETDDEAVTCVFPVTRCAAFFHFALAHETAMTMCAVEWQYSREDR